MSKTIVMRDQQLQKATWLLNKVEKTLVAFALSSQNEISSTTIFLSLCVQVGYLASLSLL